MKWCGTSDFDSRRIHAVVGIMPSENSLSAIACGFPAAQCQK